MANLVLIGAGSMGRSLALATRGASWGRLLYVSDPDRAAGERLAFETDARWINEPTKALADGAVDAVVIATPQPSHPSLALAAAQAGKHALCEKPLALSTDACRQMIRAFGDADRQLMVGHILRFDSTFMLARELAIGGGLGPPQAVFIQRSQDTWPYGGWREDRASHGGIFFEIAVHEIDFAVSVLGVPREASAACSGLTAGGMEHLAAATVRFGDNTFAALRYGIADPWGARAIEVHCRDAALRCVFGPKTGVEVRWHGDTETRFHPTAPHDNAVAEMEAFCRAIDERRPVPIPGEAGLAAVAVVEAVVTSYETRRSATVNLDEAHP